MRKTPPRLRPPLRIAAFLPLETEHGRSILRGIARYYRSRAEVTVLKFAQTSGYNAAKLKRLRVHAIIAKVATSRDERCLASLRLPVVNISGEMATTRVPMINSDDESVGRMALHHFHRRGYRNFGYAGSPTHHGSQQRLNAFREEARKSAEPGSDSTVSAHFLPLGDQTAPYPERVRQKLTDWVRQLPCPAGVFTFTDRVALEVEDACRTLGRRIPQDIAILGVGNDLTRIEFAHVELSSIQLNADSIGWLAAERVDRLLRGERVATATTLVPPMKIITRRSTDAYAVADEAVGIALDHIRENVGNAIYVDEIARAAGVSRRGLEMRFRQSLGLSIYQEVQRQQLELAADLLTQPELPIGEIAFRTGFSSNASFTRAFRRHHGKSPSAFREGRARIGR
ncbi:MAG TPA: DNA-binding transcriptional regulator [Opitutaceae bacterium]|nr:DNA-binding transcriptional regulator [Opitutaceae bacterium]